jgi:hypothetical protein
VKLTFAQRLLMNEKEEKHIFPGNNPLKPLGSTNIKNIEEKEKLVKSSVLSINYVR